MDVSALELDEMLSLSDLKLPEGVEIPALAQGPEADQPVVNIHIIKAAPIEEELEEGVEPGEEGTAEVPTIGDEAAEADED